MAPLPTALAGAIRRRARGFTLTELLVALALASLFVGLAAPGSRTQGARGEMRDRAEALAQAMTVARSEAVKRGTRVEVCPSLDRVACGSGVDWDAGWISYVNDRAVDPSAGSPSVLRREGPARPGTTIKGNRPVADYVSFTSLGHARRRDGALQMGTFTVCRSGHDAVKVVLANSGRVRVDTTREVCP